MSEIKTNKLSSLTGTNSDITIDPDGTGDTIIASGSVGIGTASPTNILHVSGTAGTPVLIERTNGAVCTLAFKGNTTTNNPYLGANGNDLYFNTGTSESMRIDSSGDLLIGATSTSNLGGINPKLIVQNSSDGIAVQEIGSGYIAYTTKPSGSHGYYAAFFMNSSTTGVGSIYCSTSGTAYNTSSDYRLKENVTATWDATTRLKQLNPVRFNFIADADTTVDGFLAHEVQTVVPEAITGTHNEVDDDGNPVYQGIDQSKLVPLLVKTIQELEARIVALETA